MTWPTPGIVTRLEFKRTDDDEVRIYKDQTYIGDIYKDEDILNSGQHYYIIWLSDDYRGWKKVRDRLSFASPATNGSPPTDTTADITCNQKGRPHTSGDGPFLCCPSEQPQTRAPHLPSAGPPPGTVPLSTPPPSTSRDRGPCFL